MNFPISLTRQVHFKGPPVSGKSHPVLKDIFYPHPFNGHPLFEKRPVNHRDTLGWIVLERDAVNLQAGRRRSGDFLRYRGPCRLVLRCLSLRRLHAALARAGAILDRAERAGDLRVALMAVREVRGGLELLAKLGGELRGAGHGPTEGTSRAGAPPARPALQ